MISKTSEYALRAVLYIAREGDGGSVRANEVSEALDVPANYLSKTLHVLAREGLLYSERGPRGGFRLVKPADEVTLADVIELLDPAMLQKTCLLGMPECSDESSCALHERWKRVREPLVAFFRETTLGEVMAGKAPLPIASS